MPRKKAVSFVNETPALTRGARIALICVEVLGLAVAFYLTLIAFRVIYDGQVPCLRSKIFACESVVRGPFSKIGFFATSFSIALMGVFYFLGQLLLTSLLDWKRWITPLKVLAVFAGLLFVAWLRALELVHMKKICPWCWGVALTVVVQTALVWPMTPRVLPPMNLFGRLAGALLFLFAFLGLTAGIEEIFKPSRRGTVYFFGHQPPPEKDEETDEEETEESGKGEVKQADSEPSDSRPKPKPKPTKTPKAVAEATPTPAPSPAPALTRRTPAPAQSAPTPTPTPQVAAADEPEPPIDLFDVPELLMLQQRGWRMAASTERVEDLIRNRGPILLMVYDPFCEECHATMRQGLSADEVDRLPVTRVAIDQSSLTGKISERVSHVPTLLLIDREGHVLYTHTGRIKAKKLVEEVSAKLGA